MKKLISPLLAAIAVMTACHKKSSDPAPIAIITEGWMKSISSSSKNTDTAVVKNGYLYLAPVMVPKKRTSIGVYSLAKLQGDFEINIPFFDFKSTGTDYGSDGIVFELNQEGQYMPIVGAGQYSELYMATFGYGPPATQMGYNSSGTFYAKRVGSDISGWFVGGTDTVRFSKANVTNAPLSILLSVLSDSTSHGASVKIPEVKILSGGGGIKSDTFDWNTIQ